MKTMTGKAFGETGSKKNRYNEPNVGSGKAGAFKGRNDAPNWHNQKGNPAKKS